MNIRKYIFGFLISGLLALSPAFAQIEDPVDWSFSSKDLGGGVFELTFRATVEPGWHIYSQTTSDDGPVPTTFTFEEKKHVELEGSVQENGKIEKGYDDLFMTDVSTIIGNATYKQKVKVSGVEGTISGYITFMVCNDEKCLPPTDEEFSFTLKGPEEASIDQSTPEKTPKPKAEKPEKELSSNEKKKKEVKENLPVEKKGILDKETEETNPLAETEADIFDPVKLTSGIRKLEEGLFELIFSLKIDEGWKIYAPSSAANGPIPLSVALESEGSRTAGTLVPDKKPKGGMDPFFNVNVEYFKDKVSFTQKIQASDSSNIEGYLTYMACNNNRCLAPVDIDFSFDLSKEDLNLANAGIFTTNNGENPFRRESITRDKPVSNCEATDEFTTESYSNLFSLFFLGLIGGIFAFLTPCVFPMVPLTVGFFTKSSENRRQGIFNGVVYGLSIFLIYSLVSLPFHLVPGLDSSIFNIISTDPILNTIFFVIFVVFAFSFFGFYEITLPSALANSVDQRGSTKGFIGIFLMALTLTIVSFSCTGPLFGTVFALSANGSVSAWSVTAAAAGFGVALGLPFAIFAAFPGLLNALPKSGSWLSTTKVVIGFIEVALAFKFLSKADLVGHWGILHREIFVGIWIVIGLLMAAYLFGFYQFPHEYKVKPLPKARIVLGVLTLALVGYIVPSFNSSSGIFSGILPPLTYSIFADDESGDCPHDLPCFKDYEEGLAYAKEVNKPIMIDFTGHGCENCRKMEENVWPEDEVYKYIAEDYVLISLYVDEREKLEEPILIEKNNGKTKKLRTIGNKWTEFQVVNFFANSQPFYVLMSPEEVLLNEPKGYTPDVDEYEAFLECGLNAFQQLAEK